MHRLNRKRFFCSWYLLWMGLLAIPTTGYTFTNEKHWLEVHVIDSQTARPLSDVSVCLGTSARPDQFGSRRTDRDGIVRFQDLLPNPLVLSVSGNGFRGQQRSVEPVYESRILVLKLASGGGGPECHAPPLQQQAAPVASGITIQRVAVSRPEAASDSTAVLVSVTVNGKANQVRIGERADFQDSVWQDLRNPVAHTLSGENVSQLYVQVRRRLEAEGVSIEEVSPVRRIPF